MAHTHTAVSIEADKLYVEALGCIAKDRGITAGKLTRDALDRVYGDEVTDKVKEIARVRGISLVDDGQSAIQSDGELLVAHG